MNTEQVTPHAPDWFIDHIRADAERFAVAVEGGPTDAEVTACPGWTVLRLTEHLGVIHRWARFCVVHGRPPDAEESAALEDFAPDDPATWLRVGAAQLCEALAAIDPDAPTWHPFPVERVARVWPRRQAHESAMHRWDAERAVGRDATIDPELASDGIDEYLEVVIPRLVVRKGIELPSGSLHLHCTDIDGEWLVWTEDGSYRMERVHQKGDAALRGPAEAMLLRLWGRDSARAEELAPIGDAAVLEAWLAIAGM